MEKPEKYGLIGYPLTHSFSKKYFTEKFSKQNIQAQYELYPLENISEFHSLIKNNPGLKGLNVTIPHKQGILPYLDHIDDTATKIGAVNTIKITRNPEPGTLELTGYNTDAIGFRESIKPFLESHHTHALILGTGGSSKAVNYVLTELGINTFFVSRKGDPSKNILSYQDLNKNVVHICKLIINTTPLGMYPEVNNLPSLPYESLGNKHFLYDLIYNPEETLFLKKAKEKGCATLNGSSMLYFQAEASWKIWNEK